MERATEAAWEAGTAAGRGKTGSETAASGAIQVRGAHSVEANRVPELRHPAIEGSPVRGPEAVAEVGVAPGQGADLVAAADGGGRGRITDHDEAKGFLGQAEAGPNSQRSLRSVGTVARYQAASHPHVCNPRGSTRRVGESGGQRYGHTQNRARSWLRRRCSNRTT